MPDHTALDAQIAEYRAAHNRYADAVHSVDVAVAAGEVIGIATELVDVLEDANRAERDDLITDPIEAAEHQARVHGITQEQCAAEARNARAEIDRLAMALQAAMGRHGLRTVEIAADLIEDGWRKVDPDAETRNETQWGFKLPGRATVWARSEAEARRRAVFFGYAEVVSRTVTTTVWTTPEVAR